jgi:hypothetical protein
MTSLVWIHASSDRIWPRYPGFSEVMHDFKQVGLLDLELKITPGEFKSWMSSLEPTTPKAQAALKWLIHRYELDVSHESSAMLHLDIFANLLARVLKYDRGEKDMVVLAHELVTSSQPATSTFEGALPPAQQEEEVHKSTLIAYGTDEHSAMALTVGLPVAIAALSVLDDKVPIRGVTGPEDVSIRTPVLEQLEDAGLGVKEQMLKDSEKSIEKRLQFMRR